MRQWLGSGVLEMWAVEQIQLLAVSRYGAMICTPNYTLVGCFENMLGGHLGGSVG